MARTFARFAAIPIGPQLAARDGGLTLTTTAAPVSVSRLARSDVAQASDTHGAEFAFWGDDALVAVIGVATSAAPLGSELGAAGGGLGWRLHTGEVLFNGAVVASGLPAVAKGDIVGVRVQFGTPHTVKFYLGSAEIHSRAVALPGPLHFAVSLASTTAGGLTCAVNAGQWQAASEAGLAGWFNADVASITSRLSDIDHLSTAGDTPAHVRYEGLLAEGIDIESQIGFWPWSGDQSTKGTSASIRVTDADALIDELAMQDVRGVPVALRLGDRGADVAAAAPVGRFVMDRVEIASDGTKVIYLADAHSDLDDSLTRGVFLPNIPALAWRPQPAVIGAVASVPGYVANSDGTVLFLSDSRLQDVATVMDRGDIMESGTFTVAPDGQQLLMTSPSMGPVVCDVSSIGANLQPATLQQALAAIFGRIGKSSWSAADAASIDTETGYAGIGYYSTGSTVREALAAILPSYGAGWWQDDDGVLRITRITDPALHSGALAFDVSRTDMLEDLVGMRDLAPNLTRRMAYRPNAQILGVSDLVTDLVDLPQSRRDELTRAWRGQIYSGGPLPQCYRHADTAAPFVSCFWRAQDAQAENDRIVALYGVPRSTFQARFKGDPSFAPKPGQIGRVTYARYGLDAGKKVLVRGRRRNPATGDVVLTLWG